jgi:Flp pilus assembly protein TadG
VTTGDDGQAAVELALALPLVALLLLLVVQLGVVVRDELLVVHAAREAARAAAVHPTAAAAGDAARAAGGLDATRLTVAVTRSGGDPPIVRATLTYREGTAVPVVGPLLPSVTLRSSVSMALEDPPGH